MSFHHFQLKQIPSTKNKHFSISTHFSFALFHSLIYFKPPWITRLSNLPKFFLGEGKTCFHLTSNNVLLLFSKDASNEGIIIDKCFIFNLFNISMNHTRTSALPSKVLLAIILEFMVKSFILIWNSLNYIH